MLLASTRVHLVLVEWGGLIRSHQAGFGQLLVPLTAPWVAGADGIATPSAFMSISVVHD